ncbi:MAG TPA: transcriptional regulator, partial [Acidimicrobiia bacterium]|nr:transcriptional regulator [Acidimicrobiia bacterium]
MTDAEWLDRVRSTAAAGEWEAAAALLLEGGSEATAEVLELTAQVAYGAGDFDGTVTAFERLHALRLGEGDVVGAAYAAAMVAVHLLIDAGMLAPVRGWMARAERLLEGMGESPVDAVLAMVRTFERLLSGDVDTARRWAPIAVELGVRHDVGPAIAMGRNGVARIAILDGRIEEGLVLLDELATSLMVGEYDALTTGIVYCELVCAMQGLAQYDRAEQWTEAMERWRVGNAFGGIHGRCRVHRAEILKLRGDCATAEAEALLACDELRPWMRREFGWPLTELGNIRLRAGDHAGAEEAFVAAQEHGWDPQPGFALLRLAQGDVGAARELVREALDHPLPIPSKERPPFGELRRAPLLEAEVPIAIAAGDVAAAQRAATELSE